MVFKKIDKNKFHIVIEFLNNNFSSPTHWPEWNLLVSKYFKTEFYYFAAYEVNNLVGICPVHETKSAVLKNLNSGQFHFIPNGGWIYKKHTIIDCYKIDIPLNSRFECFTLPVLKDFGITYTNITKLYYTLIVDLNQTEEHIWLESMNYRRRRMIKKAHKNKISVKNVNSDLSTFYSLYLAANKIYGIGNLNYSFFEELIKSEHIKFIPLVAYNSGNPCGGLGLICDANYAIYWLGVTDHNSENLGQGDLLQWEAIKYSKSLGCKYYDLCYIEKERLPTIYIFKKGFSTTEVEVPYFLKKSFMFRLINRISKLK